MTSPLNASRFFSSKGLDSTLTYVGKVVENNDPNQRKRVRVRVEGIHADSIPDEVLPWALPSSQGYAASGDQRSGLVDIPEIGALIGVKFPFKGDPLKPVQADFPGDKEHTLPEGLTNYPHRKVKRFAHGMFIVADGLTKELFINNPGDWHVTVVGDCTQTIIGNHTQIISGNMDDMPEYLREAADFNIKGIEAKNQNGVPFKGSGSKGSTYTEIHGDQTIIIHGNRKIHVMGNDELVVDKNHTEKVAGNHTIRAARSDTN